MSITCCERCGATWVNGQHTWLTGKRGSEIDLAGLVCNMVNDPRCINPKKGQTGGDSFARRTGSDPSATPGGASASQA